MKEDIYVPFCEASFAAEEGEVVKMKRRRKRSRGIWKLEFMAD